jgi:protein-S-isoprenylcysteine O-methyltransferase Ste14
VVAGRRVPLGFVFGLIVLGLAQPTPQSLVAGGLVACAGEGLRFWAAGHLNKSREVTMSGPYRWLAHPLYVGSSILGIGLALASRSVIASLLIGAYLLLTLTVAARQEEALLQKMFGDRYAGYRRGSSPADVERRFSLAQAIANGEHRTIAGLALVGLLLAGKATYNGSLG